jgi:hypothetical protein
MGLTLTDASSIATVASGIGTVVSIAFAIKALTEVRLQRESTYKPELVANGGTFYAYNHETQNGQFPNAFAWEFSYRKHRTGYKAKNRDNRITVLPIHLYNIGLGAAKNVVMSYETDTNKWLEIISEMSKGLKGELPFTFGYGNKFSFIDYRSADYVGMGRRGLPKQSKVTVNHMLPVSVRSEPYKFDLPEYMFHIISASIYTSFYASTQSSFPNIPVFPPINIKIDYLDIANKKIVKNLIGTFTLGGLGAAGTDGSKGKLTIVEVLD